MAVPNVPLRVVTHAKKICSLYKRAYRCLESHVPQRDLFRLEATLLRNRFDKNKDIKDNVKAAQLLIDGEAELHEMMPHLPLKFANSYGGLTWHRDEIITDAVLDFWHPLEKAQYPEYFERREKRKKEYTQWWEKTYGKPSSSDSHH